MTNDELEFIGFKGNNQKNFDILKLEAELSESIRLKTKLWDEAKRDSLKQATTHILD